MLEPPQFKLPDKLEIKKTFYRAERIRMAECVQTYNEVYQYYKNCNPLLCPASEVEAAKFLLEWTKEQYSKLCAKIKKEFGDDF